MTVIFFSAFALAFSGAMMPGPLLTYTIKQSLNSGARAGFIIIAGHAVLEIVLITFILLGFDIVLQSETAQVFIGIIGGAMLIYMGYDMISGAIKNRIKVEMDGDVSSAKGMLLSGIAISAANPYFFIWWAVIGLGFLLQAYKSFGSAGVFAFYGGHILADTLWYGFISTIVGSTSKFIKAGLYRAIIIILGCLLIFFGGGFLYNAISL